RHTRDIYRDHGPRPPFRGRSAPSFFHHIRQTCGTRRDHTLRPRRAGRAVGAPLEPLVAGPAAERHACALVPYLVGPAAAVPSDLPESAGWWELAGHPDLPCRVFVGRARQLLHRGEWRRTS